MEQSRSEAECAAREILQTLRRRGIIHTSRVFNTEADVITFDELVAIIEKNRQTTVE